jgi:Fe-Mn family superoxide dismutase
VTRAPSVRRCAAFAASSARARASLAAAFRVRCPDATTNIPDATKVRDMFTTDRRSFIFGSAAILASSALSRAHAQPAAGPYKLDPLPYPASKNEPHIDAQTMEIHHDRHHNTYVTNLNNAIAGDAGLEAMSAIDLIQNLEKVPEDKRTAVRNNGGGHVNHTMFWEIMGPNGGAPSGALAAAIDRDFGGLDALKDAVNKAGAGRFGSGWAWVVLKDGKLSVTSTPNQDNPLMDGSGTPILGVDVWEHAYYLKYQNKRPDYLAAWWNTVNWAAVAERYAAAGGQ